MMIPWVVPNLDTARVSKGGPSFPVFQCYTKQNGDKKSRVGATASWTQICSALALIIGGICANRGQQGPARINVAIRENSVPANLARNVVISGLQSGNAKIRVDRGRLAASRIELKSEMAESLVDDISGMVQVKFNRK